MKHYKCGFSHCAHADGKVPENEAVKIGTRYWHKDCYEISETIKDIRETYLDKISSSVVVSALNKIINNIVFGKKLENKKLTKAQSNLEAARYLQFCIDYALEHKIPITHAPGLYYLIDNVRVKKAYEKRNNDGTIGVPSKFPHLARYFSYESGELVMVSGRMKMGKSAFMLNEAMDKIQRGIPTIYFDTEMNDRLFYLRMLANLTGIDQKKIKSGNLLPEEQKIIDDTNEWLKKQPFVHEFIPNATNEELFNKCRMMKYKMGLQFVIYDYFKSAETDSSNQYNDLGAKCDFLKNRIAGELDVAVLAGAQLNREDRVADSDKLERYASVSAKWRKKTADEMANDGKECGNYAFHIALNRLGEGMFEDEYIDFKFSGAQMRIEEAKQHEEQQVPY